MDALFAVLQPASEGGGEVDGGQCSRDPLPGVLDSVLVQALAFSPSLTFLNKKKSAGARSGEWGRCSRC